MPRVIKLIIRHVLESPADDNRAVYTHRRETKARYFFLNKKKGGDLEVQDRWNL